MGRGGVIREDRRPGHACEFSPSAAGIARVGRYDVYAHVMSTMFDLLAANETT
jgi:hypothetical protein